MLRRKNNLSIVATITVLLTALTLLGNAAQKASVPKTQDKLAMGEDDVKHLLSLMETDKNGKVSRQEYMKFMAAEFDRLDKSKTGELDVKALTQSNLSASHFVGK